MRKHVVMTVALMCVSVCAAGGCAKKQLVKPDPVSSAPAQTAQSLVAVKPVPVETSVNAAPVTQDRLVAVDVPPAVSAVTSERLARLQELFETIYFDYDAALLSVKSRDALVKTGKLLQENPDVNLVVEGNCDERGSDEYNLALGEKRARAAVSYLETLGIPASRLSVISYGKEKPVVIGHDEASWARNRRDDFAIAIK